MNTRRYLLTTLSFMACCLPAMAQTESPAAAAPPPDAAAPAVIVAGAEPDAAPVTRDKDTLSVDFPDEDIKTILRNVADLFELNLVVPDTLVGKTSIKLRDVSWRQIFQVVLSPVGYTYIEEGNIIKIVSNEVMALEPGVTEVFILNNAKSADIKPTIEGLVDGSKGGKIVVDNRSNSLVITERPTQLKRIASIIEQLDKATEQVMIESKFVEVTDRDIRNIGVNWASLQGFQMGVSGIGKTYNRDQNKTEGSGNGVTNSNINGVNSSTQNVNSNTTTNNSSNLNTTTNGTNGSSNTTYVTGIAPAATIPSTFNPLTGVVSGLPTSIPTQTQQAGFVAGTPAVPALPGGTGVAGTPGTPATPDTATAFNTFTGGNSTVNSNTATTGSSVANTLSSAIADGLTNTVNNAVNSLSNLANTSTTGRLTTAVFSTSDFNIIVSALKTQNNTKIVSNPTVVTLNNTEATINIGQEFPVPSYTYNSERGSFEVSGFVYKPIGIILKVTPQVNARGIIKLALEPEVSQQNGSTSFGGAGGALIPIIATRKVKTNVSLKDGYTMGIGGLITNAMDHGGTKVPILGDIPVLGRLFSSKNVNDAATNLLIFITAKTVNADGASPEEVFDPRAVQATGMSREDLPGYRVQKGTDLYAAPVNANK